jgi:hypothetical protein
MSTYDLRAHVVAVLDETSLTDPGEIADKVLEGIPAKHLRAALAVTLRAYVRSVNAHRRGAQIPGGHSSSDAQSSCATTGSSLQAPPSDQGPLDAHCRPVARGSRKVRGIREAWRRHLNGRWHSSEDEWKQLRYMTRENLLFAAEERRITAERNLAWARILEEWAQAVAEHNVGMFGDLPEAVQADLLGGLT